MNNVTLVGRLTRDPEMKMTQNGDPMAQFTVAIDRPKRPDGEKTADFIRVKVFGKQAANCETYSGKGLLIGIEGRISTGSYVDETGNTVYTTDVIANRVEFMQFKDSQNRNFAGGGEQAPAPKATKEQKENIEPPSGFSAISEDEIPF